MKKNINNAAGLHNIIDRLAKLTPETKGLWGKMNVKQMLRHVSTAANFAFESPDLTAKRKSFLKWMIFNIPAPKNTKTLDSLDFVAMRINPESFEEERERLKAVFNKIALSNGPFTPNPFLGPLSKDEWGTLCYIHANHHLKQFRV